MRLLRAKEQMVEQVIRDRDLAKEKYISSLEHQLKTKDDMLSQVIFSITQLSTRSQSAAPIRNQSLEIEDSRDEQPQNINVLRYQEEIKEEQLNQPKINYKRNEVLKITVYQLIKDIGNNDEIGEIIIVNNDYKTELIFLQKINPPKIKIFNCIN